MSTSHLIDGASRFVRPAHTPWAGDLRAVAANDNRIPRATTLPFAHGVVLAMAHDEAGEPVVSLHLLLPDGEIGVAFHSARHDEDVIALWRGLGRDFNLPLYIRSEEGHLSALTPEPGEVCHPRRIGSPLAHRRPRFLARRRMPLKAYAPKPIRAAEQG